MHFLHYEIEIVVLYALLYILFLFCLWSGAILCASKVLLNVHGQINIIKEICALYFIISNSIYQNKLNIIRPKFYHGKQSGDHIIQISRIPSKTRI